MSNWSVCHIHVHTLFASFDGFSLWARLMDYCCLKVKMLQDNRIREHIPALHKAGLISKP